MTVGRRNNHEVSVKKFASFGLFESLATAPALAENLERFVDGELSELVTAYKEIHAHPELSHQEKETASRLAGELRKAGFTGTERVGKYPHRTPAYRAGGIMGNRAR